MAIDGNVRYEKDENGDYLTVRSTSLLDIVSPSFISNNITLLQSQVRLLLQFQAYSLQVIV